MGSDNMEHVIKQLKQVRTDAVLGKKKHYNAADRKRKYDKYVSIGQIVINALTGTALLPVVFGQGNKIAEIVALLLAIMAMILSGVQKKQDYEKQAQGNTEVADMYLDIAKRTNFTICKIADGIISNEDITKRTEELLCRIDKANKLGAQFSTNNKDYQMAREGILNGEEDYTEED